MFKLLDLKLDKIPITLESGKMMRFAYEETLISGGF